MLAGVEPRLDPDVPLVSVPESLDAPLPAADPPDEDDPLPDDDPLAEGSLAEELAEGPIEAPVDPARPVAPELVPSVCFAAAAALPGGGSRESHFMMPIAIACA